MTFSLGMLGDLGRKPSVCTEMRRWLQCLSMLAKELLKILVCPACKGPLEYRQNPETLKCSQCHRVYGVKDDIPNMLVDESTIEP